MVDQSGAGRPDAGAAATRGDDDVMALFRSYRASGDRALRNQLVERYASLSEPHVRRFGGRGIPKEDLRQTALLAVLRAVERFDPEMGVGFPTFAGRTIEGELKRFLRDRSWAVRPPRRQQEGFLNVRSAEDELVQRLGRSPTVAELAKQIGETEDRVLEALEAAGARRADSLDEPTPRGGAPRPLGQVDGDFAGVEVRLLIERMLATLDERERTVIELRFFEDLGQPEIAKRLGLSQSYVSRLIRRILGALKEGLEAEGIEPADIESVARGRS
jgi:RNA polymerase sigma-B factor